MNYEGDHNFLRNLNSMSSQTELYLQSLPLTNNVVHRSNGDGNGLKEQKEWTQVFDMKDSVLICNVEANELDMRLIHLTDQPLNDYISMIQKGRVRMPGPNLTQPFLKTEDDQREQLRSYFEEFSSAKIVVNGSIVQNLSLGSPSNVSSNSDYRNQAKGYQQLSTNTNFGYNSLTATGLQSSQYQLKFATTSNLIYTVNFERFYFKASESIFVNEPVNVTELLSGGTIKATDIVTDYKMGQEIYAVGIGLPIGGPNYQPQDTSGSTTHSQNEETLYLLRQGGDLGLQPTLLGKQNVVGLFKEFKRTIKETIKNHAQGILFSGLKIIANLSEQRVSSNKVAEEGVVAIRSLTNGLFGVVYSSGLLRVWSIHSGRGLILQCDLLQLADNDNKGAQDAQQKAFDRIVSAKITYLTKDHTNNDVSLQKSFHIAVAYQVQSFKTFGTQWDLAQFSLIFQNLPPNIDEGNESIEDLGQDAELHQIISQQFPNNTEITNLILENDTECSKDHLWVSTFNSKDKESHIVDMCQSSLIWDKTNQPQFFGFTDQVELSQELQDRPFSPYQQALKKHFYKRLTKRNRFTQVVLQQHISEQMEFFHNKRNLPMKQQLDIICKQSDVSQLKLLIKNSAQIESANSRISGMSIKLANIPIRVIVRPLGISVLKEDILITRTQNMTKQICVQLEEHKLNLNTNAIMSVLSKENYPLIFKLLGGVKFMVGTALSLIDEQIMQNPACIRDVFKTAIRESYHYESLHLWLLGMIEQGQEQIDQEQNMLTEHIVTQLLNNFAQSGRELSHRFAYPSLTAEYNHPMVKLIERGLLNEINDLYDTLRDLALLKTYIQTYIPLLVPSNQQVKYEQQSQEMLLAWLKQIAALKVTLNKNIDTDPLSIKSSQKSGSSKQLRFNEILTSYEATGNGSILQYLLCRDPMILTANQSRDVIQFDETLGFLIQAYTYKYPLEEQTYIPYLIRKLDSLQQWKALEKYLSIQDDSTIGMNFVRAYIAAKVGNNPSDFIKYINRVLTKFTTTTNQQGISDYSQLIIKQASATGIQKRIRSATQNQALEFYLTILEQLTDMDGRYSIYLIKSALQMIPYLQQKETDYLYSLLFQVSKVSTSLDYMFLACNKIQNKEMKKNVIGQFLERLCGENQQYLLTTKCFFSQDDIELALSSMFDKFEKTINESKNSQKSVTYSAKWRKDTEQLVKLLNLLAKLYSRSQEVCRFFWHVHTSLDDLISKETTNFELQSQRDNQKDQKQNENPLYTNIQEMLNLQYFVLQILLENALSIGESFIMTDDSEVFASNKKRKIGSISNASDQEMETEQQKGADKSGQSIINSIKEEARAGEFLQGSLRQVTVEEITKSCLFVKARLLCLEHSTSKNPALLVKVLTQFDEFDLACELALAYKTSVAYPLSKWIQNYTNEQFDEVQQLDSTQALSLYQHEASNINRKDQATSNKRVNSKQMIDNLLSDYLERLTTKDIIELVQRLVSQDVSIPALVEKELIKRGNFQAIVESYMSVKCLCIHQAVDVIQKYIPESVISLASTNINLLVLLLKNIDEAQDASEELLQSLTQQEAELESLGGEVIGASGSRSFIPADRGSRRDISAQFSRFSEDLNEFYGAQLEENQGEDGNLFDNLAKNEAKGGHALGQIKSRIVQERAIIQTLKQGSIEIKQVLVTFLNT